MVFDFPLEFKLICQSTGHLSWVWPHHLMSDQRHIVSGVKLIVILNCTYVWMWVQVVVCLFVLALRQARNLSGVWPASCSMAAGIASFFSRVIILIHVYWDFSVLGPILLLILCLWKFSLSTVFKYVEDVLLKTLQIYWRFIGIYLLKQALKLLLCSFQSRFVLCLSLVSSLSLDWASILTDLGMSLSVEWKPMMSLSPQEQESKPCWSLHHTANAITVRWKKCAS